MKKAILLISLFAFCCTEITWSQCTGCTINVTSSTSSPINASNGAVVCINENFTGDIQNLANGTICVASGVIWAPPTSSWSNGTNVTVQVNGTLITSLSNFSSNNGVIRVESGGRLNTLAPVSFGSGTQVVLKTGSEWEAFAGVRINTDGPGNTGGLIVEQGAIATFNRSTNNSALENNEGIISIAGEVIVNGEFYNHGMGLIDVTGVVNASSFRMTQKAMGELIVNGFLNVQGNSRLENQGPTGSGTFFTGGDLTLTNAAGLGGSLMVRVEGVSTLGQCGTNISSNITFCDSSPGGDNIGDFDNNNCTGTRGYSVLSDCGTILPVELLYFKSKRIGTEHFALEWSIADATNFSHFVVEVSKNGKTFKRLEKVDFDNVFQTYQSRKYVLPAVYSLYRLKMVDLDGSYEYSNLISLDAVKNTLRIYPNPTTKNFVTIEQMESEQIIANIFSTTGEALKSYILKGSTRHEIELPEQQSGVYIVELISGSEVLTTRIVKN